MKYNKTTIEHCHELGDTVFILVNKPTDSENPVEALQGKVVVSEPLIVDKILAEVTRTYTTNNYVLVDLDGDEVPGEYHESTVFKTQEEAEKAAKEVNDIPF